MYSVVCCYRWFMCICVNVLKLFDVDNHVNREAIRYLFNTEGHLFPITSLHRSGITDEFTSLKETSKVIKHERQKAGGLSVPDKEIVVNSIRHGNMTSNVSITI